MDVGQTGRGTRMGSVHPPSLRHGHGHRVVASRVLQGVSGPGLPIPGALYHFVSSHFQAPPPSPFFPLFLSLLLPPPPQWTLAIVLYKITQPGTLPLTPLRPPVQPDTICSSKRPGGLQVQKHDRHLCCGLLPNQSDRAECILTPVSPC